MFDPDPFAAPGIIYEWGGFGANSFDQRSVPESHAEIARKIVELLHTKRKQRGFSQESLALAADVSPSCIQHLESNRSTPTLITLLKLCEALEIDLADLLRTARRAR